MTYFHSWPWNALIGDEPRPTGWTKLVCLDCETRWDIPSEEDYKAKEEMGENPSELDRCPRCKSDNVDFGN